MKTRFLAGWIGLGVLVAPLVYGETPKKQPAMSEDMRRAIAFERYKDLAAARQARKEAIHPSVTYSNANRSVDEPEQGQKVKDPGPAVKKDK
ncbi:conserved exported hypothetical protein [Candidatus Sulfopaludibacter sp. SbA4]|nr:conserved exported hypothetical protein [Candidatus Sulfopaludibacter sp. SbA4]